MVRKAIIILLTILTAFTVFSAGYGMWERKLVIKGCIEVNQPDSTAPANDTTKIVRPIDLKARDDHQSDKSDQGEETNTDGNVNQPEVKDQSGDNGEQPTDTEDQSTDNGSNPQTRRINRQIMRNNPQIPRINPGMMGNNPQTPRINPGIMENNPQTPRINPRMMGVACR